MECDILCKKEREQSKHGFLLWIRTDSRGQHTLEFVVSFTIVVAFVLLLADAARVTYAWGVIHHAMSRGLRESRQLTDANAIAFAIERRAEALGVDIQPGEIRATVNARVIWVRTNVRVELPALGAIFRAWVGNPGLGVNVRARERMARRITNLTETAP